MENFEQCGHSSQMCFLSRCSYILVELGCLTLEVTLLRERGGREGLVVTSSMIKLLLEVNIDWTLSAVEVDDFTFILDLAGFSFCLVVLGGILEVLRLMLLPRFLGLAPNADLDGMLLGTLLLVGLLRTLNSVF